VREPTTADRFCAFLAERCGVAAGESGVVAVSGGADSVGLLDLMVAAGARLGLELAVVTVDHGLRAGAADEARFVVGLAARLGVSAEVVRVDVTARARRDGRGISDAARQERLEALERERMRRGAAWIALGHTRTDQAETLLLRLERGAGLDGLGCMAPRRGALVRPLLWAGRDEIRAHLAARGLEHVEDPSNADRRFARAVVRQDLGHLVDERLLADIAADASSARALLGRGEAAWLARHGRRVHGHGVVLEADGWLGPAAAVRRRVVRRAIAAAIPSAELGRRHVDDVVRLGAGHEIHLPAGVAARGPGGRLLVAPRRPRAEAGERLVVSASGRFRSDALALAVDAGGAEPCSPIWGRVPLPIAFEVRYGRPGDRIAERGSKLKRRLPRQGAWRHLRPFVPVVARGDRILWTALRPDREGEGALVSIILDRDHPLRLWQVGLGRGEP